MKSTDKFQHRTVLKKLVEARGDLSLIEQDYAIEADVQRETSDWVPMWVDLAHAVRSDRLHATAYRAITDEGLFVWFVKHDNKRKGFHSRESTAIDAFLEASETWAIRRAIKKDWNRLDALRRDLLRGRASFEVTVEDARAGGLCTLGIEGFMKRFGIAKRRRISGRLAAFLMQFEPQMGFAIYQAAKSKGHFAVQPEKTAASAGSAPLQATS